MDSHIRSCTQTCTDRHRQTPHIPHVHTHAQTDTDTLSYHLSTHMQSSILLHHDSLGSPECCPVTAPYPPTTRLLPFLMCALCVCVCVCSVCVCVCVCVCVRLSDSYAVCVAGLPEE